MHISIGQSPTERHHVSVITPHRLNCFIRFIGGKSIRDILKSYLSAFRTLLEQALANRSK